MSEPPPVGETEQRRGARNEAQQPDLVPGDAALLRDVAGGDASARRRGVARAITLLESTRGDHRQRADALLTALPAPTEPALRLGISGVPGVGKSTFIEALGLHLVSLGHRIAVLAVDPSSSLSGGSILGDKTRMERLSVHDRAFIRPSPSRGTLGGVAAATREAIRVVEAAGYDVVIVETVGVGQSEAAVAAMTDVFMLLQLPNAGDDLQASKKGVLEFADIVVVNKADLDADAAARAMAQIGAALHLVSRRGGEQPQVVTASALDAGRVAEVWRATSAIAEARRASGALMKRRKRQAEAWLWERIDAGLRERFRAHAEVRRLLPATLDDVAEERKPVSVAARELLVVCGIGADPPARGAADDPPCRDAPAAKP